MPVSSLLCISLCGHRLTSLQAEQQSSGRPRTTLWQLLQNMKSSFSLNRPPVILVLLGTLNAECLFSGTMCTWEAWPEYWKQSCTQTDRRTHGLKYGSL